MLSPVRTDRGSTRLRTAPVFSMHLTPEGGTGPTSDLAGKWVRALCETDGICACETIRREALAAGDKRRGTTPFRRPSQMLCSLSSVQNVDGARREDGHHQQRGERLHHHQHFDAPGERQRIGGAKRRGVGKGHEQVVDKGRAPARRPDVWPRLLGKEKVR